MAFQDYMPDFTTGETEEERRKRLEEEARARGELPPVAPVAPIPSAEPLTAPAEEVTPIKQTITTDPKTGEQTMKLEGRVEDLSAANPLTPTVTGPAVPEQPPVQQPPVQQPQMAAPQAPVAPVSPEAAMPQPQPEAQPTAGPQLGQKPQPKPLTPQQQARLPGAAPQAIPPGPTTFSDIQGQETPVGGAPGFQPAVAQAPVSPTAPQPAAAPAAQPAPTATPEQLQSPWEQKLTQAKTTQDYEALLTDPATPQALRPTIAKAYSESLQRDDKQRQAEKQLETMTPTDLARVMSKKSEEGSYLKAILFARLGLNDLARSEQEKLGAGTKFESMMGADGNRYTAEIGADGALRRAFNTAGQSVDDKTLAELSANALPTKGIGHAGATRIRDSKGTEWSVVPTTRGSVFYDNSGRVGTPVGATTPITTGSDVMLEYNKRFYGAQGSAQGKAAGEGFTPGATVAAPGMPAGTQITSEGAVPTFSDPSIRVTSAGRTNAQQQALWDESVAAGRPGRTAQGMPIAKPGTSAHEGRGAIDVDPTKLTKSGRAELAAKGYYQPLPEDPVHWERIPGTTTSSGAVIPAAGMAPSAPGVGGPAQQRAALETGAKRTEAFNKIIDTEYRENGQKGEVVSSNRKQQFDILNRIDPKTGKGMAETISGLYTAANESPGNKKLTIFRDIVLGKVVPEKEISERAAELGLSSEALGALQQYNGLNAQIAAQTLRETAGAGSVSDSEQAANRARNVDITKAPMLGAYNMMAQSQFNADLQRYKSDLSATTQAPNATAFDREFRKYSQDLLKSYREVTEARLDFIAKNGGAGNPAAIREGYKRYPVPEYDAASGQWKYLKPLNAIFK